MSTLPDLSHLSSLGTAALLGGALIGVSYLVKSSVRHSGLPPGPTRVPILGNIEFAPKGPDDFNSAFQELCEKYGSIFSFYIGNAPVVVISDQAILKEAFVTKGIETAGRPDSTVIKFYNPGYPNTKGIVDASYSVEWKRQRNTALSILRTLGWGRSVIEEIIQDECQTLLGELDKTTAKPFDPGDLLVTCVSNIICSLLFGERFKHGDPEVTMLIKAIDDLMLYMTDAGTADYIFFMRFTTRHKTALAKLKDAGDRLIAFYREQIEKAKLRLAESDESAIPQDFVCLYLKELKSLGDPDSRIQEDWLIQNISDFFLAGAETTATTLRWAVLYMANNPDTQDKVHHEIMTVLGEDHTISLKDRENLPYTEATIMEIQRVSALAPVGLPHVAMKDVQIAGYNIPADTEIWGNLYGILRDPKVFPEPEKFQPERFLNEKQDSTIKVENWIPFSMGRRTCLGEQLARQELFLFFSNILKNFKILPPEGVQKISFHEVFKFVLKPSYHEVRFVRR